MIKIKCVISYTNAISLLISFIVKFAKQRLIKSTI
jgi:hypothetical protein